MEPPLPTVVSRAYSGKRISGPPNWEVGFEGAQAWLSTWASSLALNSPQNSPPSPHSYLGLYPLPCNSLGYHG